MHKFSGKEHAQTQTGDSKKPALTRTSDKPYFCQDCGRFGEAQHEHVSIHQSQDVTHKARKRRQRREEQVHTHPRHTPSSFLVQTETDGTYKITKVKENPSRIKEKSLTNSKLSFYTEGH